MAAPRLPDPVLLVVAAFSRHSAALAWARARLEALFGPVALAAAPYPFVQTAYYEPTMGAGLLKQLLVFQQLVPPEELAAIKLRTNELEEELQRSRTYAEPRPLNLDPGILSLGKFQLATTKDQAHRVYLRNGIFTEVTLRFHAGRFEPWIWTYADYRLPEVIAFLNEARSYYRQRLREVTGTAQARRESDR